MLLLRGMRGVLEAPVLLISMQALLAFGEVVDGHDDQVDAC